jgi:hypothetical protein
LTDWFEEVPETYIPQQLGSTTIGNTINDLGSIFGWIDMHTKRTRTEGLSTIFTIAFATSNTSASGAAVNSNPFMISLARLAVVPTHTLSTAPDA